MTVVEQAFQLDEEPTLLIIDLQQMFVNLLDDVVETVVDVVVRAKQRNAPIVSVEMCGCGGTHESVRNLLEGYPRHCIVRKPENDGSAEILEACWNRGFGTARFTLCGVSFKCCVLKTAEGLVSFDPTASISILVDATDARKTFPKIASNSSIKLQWPSAG